MNSKFFKSKFSSVQLFNKLLKSGSVKFILIIAILLLVLFALLIHLKSSASIKTIHMSKSVVVGKITYTYKEITGGVCIENIIAPSKNITIPKYILSKKVIEVNIENKNYASVKVESIFVKGMMLYGSKINSILFVNICPQLTALDLEGNKLKSIDFKNIKNLTYINLALNNIKNMSCLKNFKLLNKLEYLNLEGNNFSDSLDLTGKKNIFSLTLIGNKIRAIKNINAQKNLEFIYANDVGLTSSLNFSNFRNLKNVLVRGNSISIIVLTNCVKLNYLDVSKNKIKTLNLKGLKALKTLIVAKNAGIKIYGLSELNLKYFMK